MTETEITQEKLLLAAKLRKETGQKIDALLKEINSQIAHEAIEMTFSLTVEVNRGKIPEELRMSDVTSKIRELGLRNTGLVHERKIHLR
jgi:hypothetical protein